MKLYIDRFPSHISVTLEETATFKRVVDVERPEDAFYTLGVSIEPGALHPLAVLFAFARVISVEIEYVYDNWRTEVVYWRAGLGDLAHYETAAPTLTEALFACVGAVMGRGT